MLTIKEGEPLLRGSLFLCRHGATAKHTFGNDVEADFWDFLIRDITNASLNGVVLRVENPQY